MIQQLSIKRQQSTWEDSLKSAFRCPHALLQYLELPENAIALPKSGKFNLLAPLPYVERIRKGDIDDPLLQQVLPRHEESLPALGYSPDPLEEAHTGPVPGLLHKFARRVLLTVTGTCPVHCRYCFRRHFPYSEHVGRPKWEAWIAYLHEHPEVDEVILSGGDPLSLPDRLLFELIEALSQVRTVKLLRFHTRFPVVIPSRITDELLAMLKSSRFSCAMILHINHPNECDAALKAAVQGLHHAQVTVLNQSVLLKGINDSVETLRALSFTLFETGILPYYLHLLDRVEGGQHFEVPDSHARQLKVGLKDCLPGYLLPRFVREVPGAPSKVVLD